MKNKTALLMAPFIKLMIPFYIIALVFITLIVIAKTRIPKKNRIDFSKVGLEGFRLFIAPAFILIFVFFLILIFSLFLFMFVTSFEDGTGIDFWTIVGFLFGCLCAFFSIKLFLKRNKAVSFLIKQDYFECKPTGDDDRYYKPGRVILFISLILSDKKERFYFKNVNSFSYLKGSRTLTFTTKKGEKYLVSTLLNKKTTDPLLDYLNKRLEEDDSYLPKTGQHSH